METSDEELLKNSNPSTPMGKFWTWWRIRIVPHLKEPINPQADTSIYVAYNEAVRQMGETHRFVIKFKELQSEVIAKSISLWMN